MTMTKETSRWSPGNSKFAALLMFGALLATAGCGQSGPPRAGVEGTVQLDGLPLASGMVRFVPTAKTGGPTAVATVKHGEFKLPAFAGPMIGENRIEIEATDYQGFAIDDEKAFAHNVATRGALPRNPVPEIYNMKSTVKKQVRPGDQNKFDFQLQGAAATVAGNSGGGVENP